MAFDDQSGPDAAAAAQCIRQRIIHVMMPTRTMVAQAELPPTKRRPIRQLDRPVRALVE